MPHRASLHEAIYSNDVLTYIHPEESQKLRALLAGKTVGVDVSFMAGFGSCDTIADLGKEIGKVCVGLILAGAIPVLFVERRSREARQHPPRDATRGLPRGDYGRGRVRLVERGV